MPKLLSRSKHEEFESNSALQIRDQKERRVENAKKIEHNKNFANFATCKISQVAKFRNLRNLAPTSTVHLEALFTIQPLFTYPAF